MLTNSEKIAKEWLKLQHPNHIVKKLQNPDYYVNGQYYEVKMFMQPKKILFSRRQIATFDEIQPNIIIVDNNQVSAVIPWQSFDKSMIYLSRMDRESKVPIPVPHTTIIDGKTVKILVRIGNSEGFIFSKDECRRYNLKEGDVIVLPDILQVVRKKVKN